MSEAILGSREEKRAFYKRTMRITLPIALQTIAGGTGGTDLSRAGATMAAAFITTVPTIVLFVLMQKKVMQTMAFSGIK